MKTTFQPLQLLLLMFSGWVNRHHQKIIEYIHEENHDLVGRVGVRVLRRKQRFRVRADPG